MAGRNLAVSMNRGITEREQQILALLRLRLRDKDIAVRLHISHRTVHAHLRSLFRKLGMSRRAEAAEAAVVPEGKLPRQFSNLAATPKPA
jgi:DNA-binding NarL/FixJ family response regulator